MVQVTHAPDRSPAAHYSKCHTKHGTRADWRGDGCPAHRILCVSYADVGPHALVSSSKTPKGTLASYTPLRSEGV